MEWFLGVVPGEETVLEFGLIAGKTSNKDLLDVVSSVITFDHLFTQSVQTFHPAVTFQPSACMEKSPHNFRRE